MTALLFSLNAAAAIAAGNEIFTLLSMLLWSAIFIRKLAAGLEPQQNT